LKIYFLLAPYRCHIIPIVQWITFTNIRRRTSQTSICWAWNRTTACFPSESSYLKQNCFLKKYIITNILRCVQVEPFQYDGDLHW